MSALFAYTHRKGTGLIWLSVQYMSKYESKAPLPEVLITDNIKDVCYACLFVPCGHLLGKS